MNNRFTKPIFNELKKGYRDPKEIPYIPHGDIDIQKRLKGKIGKRFRQHLQPQIEKSWTQKTSIPSAVRFGEILISHFVDGYNRNPTDPHGVELALDEKSSYSIQAKGTKGITDGQVERVVNWLIKQEYIRFYKAFQEHNLEKDTWTHHRSTVLVATGKLYNLLLEDPPVKTCTECGSEKDLTYFSKQRDGYESKCKVCRAKLKRESRQMRQNDVPQKQE
ncbi:hypothetical protein P4C99_04350 [Pontiellaceae bacterium B1224]|nr:hypothetical protein [Pontiellaceae bacterium B1224]